MDLYQKEQYDKITLGHMESEYIKIIDSLRMGHSAHVVKPNEGRTAEGYIKGFGAMIKSDIGNNNFPLFCLKKIYVKAMVEELLWFLQGSTNANDLSDKGVRIWDEWKNDKGEIGPMYGAQWVNWQGSDGQSYNQIEDVISSIKNRPHSRRHVVSAWNVAYLPDERKTPKDNVNEGRMALAPCHAMFQFCVMGDKLDILVFQRSCDLFLGVPFNISSYALLLHMVAHQCDLIPGIFNYVMGDYHIYLNHTDQIQQLMNHYEAYHFHRLYSSKTNIPAETGISVKFLRKPESIFDYKFEDIVFENYQSLAAIPAKVAV